jgi:hypothetical protein
MAKPDFAGIFLFGAIRRKVAGPIVFPQSGRQSRRCSGQVWKGKRGPSRNTGRAPSTRRRALRLPAGIRLFRGSDRSRRGGVLCAQHRLLGLKLRET